ncbi:MAG: hypothetical protein CMD83_19560 [Gammaproteobacteria bacterium]|nr:hypothetical protein [Gammaproteobacteria bacterium]
MSLTAEQHATYASSGYLTVPAVFRQDELAAMRSAADEILELIVNSSLANGRHSGRLDLRDRDGEQIVRKIQPINDLSLVLAGASSDARFLTPLAELLGDEPVLMEEKLNYKQSLGAWYDTLSPRPDDTRFPIHNDWAYYKMNGYPSSVISSCILLDDCTPENGPLRFWPASHRHHLEHESVRLGLQVKEGLIDPDAGTPIIAEAGSVVYFSSLLVHASSPNETARPRRLMIYSHTPKRSGMPPDLRNGPMRLRESPHELAYLSALAKGELRPTYTAS